MQWSAAAPRSSDVAYASPQVIDAVSDGEGQDFADNEVDLQRFTTRSELTQLQSEKNNALLGLYGAPTAHIAF